MEGRIRDLERAVDVALGQLAQVGKQRAQSRQTREEQLRVGGALAKVAAEGVEGGSDFLQLEDEEQRREKRDAFWVS